MSTHAQWGRCTSPSRKEGVCRPKCSGVFEAKNAEVPVRLVCVGACWCERVSASIRGVGSSVMQSAGHIMKVFLTRRIPQEGMKILSAATGVYG